MGNAINYDLQIFLSSDVLPLLKKTFSVIDFRMEDKFYSSSFDFDEWYHSNPNPISKDEIIHPLLNSQPEIILHVRNNTHEYDYESLRFSDENIECLFRNYNDDISASENMSNMFSLADYNSMDNYTCTIELELNGGGKGMWYLYRHIDDMFSMLQLFIVSPPSPDFDSQSTTKFNSTYILGMVNDEDGDVNEQYIAIIKDDVATIEHRHINKFVLCGVGVDCGISKDQVETIIDGLKLLPIHKPDMYSESDINTLIDILSSAND